MLALVQGDVPMEAIASFRIEPESWLPESHLRWDNLSHISYERVQKNSQRKIGEHAGAVLGYPGQGTGYQRERDTLHSSSVHTMGHSVR